MFQKMGNSVIPIILVSWASINPNSYCGSWCTTVFRCYTQTTFQNSHLCCRYIYQLLFIRFSSCGLPLTTALLRRKKKIVITTYYIRTIPMLRFVKNKISVPYARIILRVIKYNYELHVQSYSWCCWIKLLRRWIMQWQYEKNRIPCNNMLNNYRFNPLIYSSDKIAYKLINTRYVL